MHNISSPSRLGRFSCQGLSFPFSWICVLLTLLYLPYLILIFLILLSTLHLLFQSRCLGNADIFLGFSVYP